MQNCWQGKLKERVVHLEEQTEQAWRVSRTSKRERLSEDSDQQEAQHQNEGREENFNQGLSSMLVTVTKDKFSKH